jgi:hypothetical protein
MFMREQTQEGDSRLRQEKSCFVTTVTEGMRGPTQFSLLSQERRVLKETETRDRYSATRGNERMFGNGDDV